MKSKTIKIIPQEEFSENFVNIEPASKFLPEWYRKSESQIKGTDTELSIYRPSVTNSTYKKCTPFLDAMTVGYIAFLTADIEVTQKPDGSPFIMWRTSRHIITEHNYEQWEGLPVPEGYHMFVYKWHNQFGLKTPEGYSLLFTSPFNRFDLPFKTISGLVDTDEYNLAVHFPFFIKKGFTGIINKGTPICQIVPIKNDNWNRSIDEFDKTGSFLKEERYNSRIKRSYKNSFWKRKEYK
jgi:hypothetical protein